MALDFAAGLLGGCAGVLVGHPLDTVKVCLQTQDFRNPRYKGTLHCFKSILTEQGFKGLYRGVSSPLAGVAGINAIVFGVYANTQRCLPNPDSLMSHLYAGAASGFIQSFISSPTELAKTVMQVGNTRTTSPLECLKSIYNTRGVKGVYRGLTLTLLRDTPGFASYFWAYELVTRRNDGLPISTLSMLAGGGIAGVVSWLLPYPVDVVKSRFQVDGITSTLYKNPYDCLVKSVKNEGVSCLFRGVWPTVIRAVPVNAVIFTVVTWTMTLMNDVHMSAKVVNNFELLLAAYADVILLNAAEHAVIAIN